MSEPKGFIKFNREDPVRRSVSDRVQDSKEFYLPVSDELLITQASRCMDCGVAFCHSDPGCPVENLIPEWNELVTQGRYKDALKQLHSTNNFPEFTGRLCPAPCESACVLGINADPVSIRMIESNIVDRGFEEGWVEPIFPVTQTGKKVAIIGSGPAGLTAAQQLVRAGHRVTVFEKNSKIGGLLRYGIPDFKIEKNIIDRRLEQMMAEGVHFKTSVNVGVDFSIETLKNDFDVVCLTTGAEAPRDLSITGRALSGIHFAMDYLTQANKAVAGEPLSGEIITAKDKSVLVIGGGDTGSDCIGTAHRQGAKIVHQLELMPAPPLERSSESPWPYWPMKLRTSHAHEEGAQRQWGMMTTAFIGQNGSVTHIEGHRVKFGNKKFIQIDQSEFKIETDLVLLALGFTGQAASSLLSALGVQTNSKNNIHSPEGFQTTTNGIFVAGDAKRGASLIVWAIAEGRKMAAEVEKYLSLR